MRPVGLVTQVVASRPEPELLELCVIDKDVGCTRSVGAVFEIIPAPVQQQLGAVGVIGDGRVNVVLAVDDDRARRLVRGCLRQGPRGEKRVEGDHGQAGGLKEDAPSSRQSARKARLAARAQRAHGADQEGNRGQGQREAQVGKGLRVRSSMWPSESLYAVGCLLRAVRNVPRSGHVANGDQDSNGRHRRAGR